MRWYSNYQSGVGHKFEIEFDEFAGYYFYASGGTLEPYDGLQDTLSFAKEEALEEYGVPLESWVQVEA